MRLDDLEWMLPRKLGIDGHADKLYARVGRVHVCKSKDGEYWLTVNPLTHPTPYVRLDAITAQAVFYQLLEEDKRNPRGNYDPSLYSI